MKMVMTDARFVIVRLLMLSGCHSRFYIISSPEQHGMNILYTHPLCLGC